MSRDVLLVTAIIVLILLNIPFYLFLGKRFFGNWAGFYEAVRFSFTSKILAASKEDFHDKLLAEMKMWIFFVICALSFICPYAVIYLWLMDRG